MTLICRATLSTMTTAWDIRLSYFKLIRKLWEIQLELFDVEAIE